MLWWCIFLLSNWCFCLYFLRDLCFFFFHFWFLCVSKFWPCRFWRLVCPRHFGCLHVGDLIYIIPWYWAGFWMIGAFFKVFLTNLQCCFRCCAIDGFFFFVDSAFWGLVWCWSLVCSRACWDWYSLSWFCTLRFVFTFSLMSAFLTELTMLFSLSLWAYFFWMCWFHHFGSSFVGAVLFSIFAYGRYI